MNKTPSRVERETVAALQRRSRRGFLTAAIAAVAAAGIWKWLNIQPEADGLVSPFRKAMEFNAGMARRLFRDRALAPEFEPSKAVRSFRRNGDIGLSEIRPEDWRLQLVGVSNPASYAQYSGDVSSWTYGMKDSSPQVPDVDANKAPKKLGMHEEDAKGAAVTMKPMEMPEDTHAAVPGLLLTMADVRKLPHVEMVTEFKCIEGWSEIVYWGGVRLRDFLAAFPPQRPRDSQSAPTEFATGFPKYLGLDTPDGQYYVGIEREVALHPQTLLAYELNGQPLTPDHGAPLRLVTPLKYGIKQLKQIGRITYSNVRPHDYWYEQGYDYYAGL
jgi:DMSO/TMAO reductase YedYZ molybdopterin-dependent catalytic subunit